jgi:hypothetical protein
MSPREPSGRHIAESLADLGDDDTPEPQRRVRKNDVTISLPVKAFGALLLAIAGGGGVYGGHVIGGQRGDRAVAELQAMDVRVRMIEDGRRDDAGDRKALIQKIDDKFEAIGGKMDDIQVGIDKINTRLDKRGGR